MPPVGDSISSLRHKSRGDVRIHQHTWSDYLVGIVASNDVYS